MRWTRRSWLLGASSLLAGCTTETVTHAEPAIAGLRSRVHERARRARLPFHPKALLAMRERLAPLHVRTTTPLPGEWRYDHPEPGQSFEEYLASSPTLPTKTRRTLVVQPLGAFGAVSRRVVDLTADFLACHFGLPVRTADSVELASPPAWAHRRRAEGEQLHTGWLLHEVLPPHLPDDAMALVAFLATDLWPGEGWNYVFGEATLSDRVGVWSLARYGDPTLGDEAFRTALRRTLKIAAHETGHMFALHHCTAYKCLQSGVNSLDEADASPLWLCPDCLAKIAWATRTDPRDHLARVRDFCRAHELSEEADLFARSIALLEA